MFSRDVVPQQSVVQSGIFALLDDNLPLKAAYILLCLFVCLFPTHLPSLPVHLLCQLLFLLIYSFLRAAVFSF